MKKYRTTIFIVLALALAATLASRDSAGRGTPVETQQVTAPSENFDPLCDAIGNFFENLSDSSKGPRKAVDEFVKNSPMAENEKTKSKIVDGLKTIELNFGNYVAYEQIGVKKIGTDLVVFRYLYKSEDYPVVWYFTYYRPRAKSAEGASNDWSLIGFRYDTNLDVALLDATFD